MASPLRPTMYGTPSGVALDEGAAEAERRARARALPSLTPEEVAAGERQKAKVAAQRAAPTIDAARPAATPGNVAPAEAAKSTLRQRVVGGAGNIAGKAVRGVGSTAAGLAKNVGVVAPLAGFGDYKANVAPGVDTSAMGTLRALGQGDFAGAGASLSGGAAEALADSGRGVAKTVDGIAGLVGAKPGATQAFDNAVQQNLGGYLSLRNPPAAVTAAAGKALPVGGAGGTGTPKLPSGAYITGDGRIGQLPPGITVAYTKDGRPAFGGGQSAASQALLQGGQPAAGPVAESPLRRPDLANLASGFNQAPSRAGEINKYFDGLAKQIQDLHGSAKFEAKGSLATKLLELEKARATALGQNAGQRIDSQGQQVADLVNRRNAEVGLYNVDSDAQSSRRRDSALERVKRMELQNEALKSRQAMSEEQLKLLDERATAAATDSDGKVDLKKKQQIKDAAVVNFGGSVDGSAPTLGASAAEGADAATMGEVVAAMNNGVGAGNESNTLPALTRLREPTWGEAFDSRSNVTIRDNLRRLVDGLPLVADSRVVDDSSGDPRVLRARDTTRTQRETLRRRGQLTVNEEDFED